jgi:MoaA/NifB/PqqE/SkfB family radical SAM enzyme
MSASEVCGVDSRSTVSRVAGPAKVAAEPEKLRAYLRGEEIFPTTLELDLTTACTRTCPECPSTTAPVQRTLERPWLEWLLASLEGRTPGLLLTGGEPTMAPLFPAALALARGAGFREIAVVTNGGCLDEVPVVAALLAHATTIRLSLYDWTGPAGMAAVGDTLRRIAALRGAIDRSGSALRIGVSALTSTRRAPRLAELAREVRAAGAHWLYFHPLCRKWGQGAPELDDQDSVLAEIAALAAAYSNGFSVGTCPERYAASALHFAGYHAAHFLLVVGADGCNYLAPEVKYQAPYVIADLSERPRDPLRLPPRTERIRGVRSDDYPARGSRHRGILYCDWIERARTVPLALPEEPFMFPYIL